jgi:hypothetical protein
LNGFLNALEYIFLWPLVVPRRNANLVAEALWVLLILVFVTFFIARHWWRHRLERAERRHQEKAHKFKERRTGKA